MCWPEKMSKPYCLILRRLRFFPTLISASALCLGIECPLSLPGASSHMSRQGGWRLMKVQLGPSVNTRSWPSLRGFLAASAHRFRRLRHRLKGPTANLGSAAL